VQPDPYRVLGIPHGASWAVVQDAYRRLSLVHHPDRGGSPERFREIQRAVEALRGRPEDDESLEERLARMEAELADREPRKRGEDPSVTRVNGLIDGLDDLASRLDKL
jgi:curved DNA-binding protein CbpA